MNFVRACPLVPMLVLCLATPELALGQGQRVSVEGGRDATGQNYRWRVRNLSDQPIVGIEIPHFRADMWIRPPGWNDEGTTNLQNVNVAGLSGVCIATASTPTEGIPPQGVAEFGMRIAAAGANAGPGTVLVRFADGSTVQVSGVELPVGPSNLDKLIVPGGLGMLLILVLVLRRRARRRRRDEQAMAVGSDEAAT